MAGGALSRGRFGRTLLYESYAGRQKAGCFHPWRHFVLECWFISTCSRAESRDDAGRGSSFSRHSSFVSGAASCAQALHQAPLRRVSAMTVPVNRLFRRLHKVANDTIFPESYYQIK
ncbi:hypothetical protein MRX96_058612 [Rhipicephalus microplus]